MSRLDAMAARLFTSLGVVLLGFSILAVPANAFADGGTFNPPPGQTCEQYCTALCNGNSSCYSTCMTQCDDFDDCFLGIARCEGWMTENACNIPQSCWGLITKCWCRWDLNAGGLRKCKCERR